MAFPISFLEPRHWKPRCVSASKRVGWLFFRRSRRELWWISLHLVIKAFPSRDCSDTPRPNDQPYRDAQRRALNTIVVGRKRSGESDLEKYVGGKFGRAMVGHWKRNLRPVKVPTLWCVGVFHLQNYRMRLIQLQRVDVITWNVQNTRIVRQKWATSNGFYGNWSMLWMYLFYRLLKVPDNNLTIHYLNQWNL